MKTRLEGVKKTRRKVKEVLRKGSRCESEMVMLRGRMIDAEKALRESAREKESPSLVPASWELVSHLPWVTNAYWPNM